jgi:hypothetical protein
MGHYIEVPSSRDKANLIVDGHAVGFNGESLSYAAEHTAKPASFSSVPAGKALVCVIDNGLFEAAGWAYDESEFMAFAYPDGRPRRWLLMDREAAVKATGFNPQPSETAAA